MTPENINADRFAERAVAGIAVLAAAAGLMAEQFPRAAVTVLCLLALALVWAAIASELARRPQDDCEHTDSDMHLADVAHQDEAA